MNRELTKTISHAGVYAVGVLLNRAVSFVMLPIYTRYLSPADYGVLELLELTVDLVSIVTGLGLAHGLFKFYNQYDTARDKCQVVSTLFMLVILAYSVTCATGALFSRPIAGLVLGEPGYARLVLVSFVNLLLSFLIYIPLAYLQVRKRSIFFVTISLLKLVLSVGLNIVFVVFLEMKVLGVLYSTLLASLVIGGALTVHTFREVGLGFSRPKAAELLRFGYPFVGMGLAAFITTFSDRYFLNYYRDVDSVGLYALGYKFGFLLMMFPVRPIFNIWMPQRFELARKENYEGLVNRFLTGFTATVLFVALLIAVSVRDVLRIMAAPEFWGAHTIVPIILLAYFFQACTDFFNFGIHYTGKTKHMAYGTGLAAAVIIVLSFLLIPSLGPLGAAVATVVAFFVRLAYVYEASQRLYRIDYQLAKPLKVLGASVGVFLLHRAAAAWIPGLSSLSASILFSAALMVLFLVLLGSVGVVSPEERRALFRLVRAPQETFAKIREQLT